MNYRWSLSRTINLGKKTIVFIGLNPSNANAIQNDPTLRRLLSFSRYWGYKKLVVVNLFARISTSPCALRTFLDPVGKKNDSILASYAFKWSRSQFWDLWLGWGDGGLFQDRNLEVISFLKLFGVIRSKTFPNSYGPMALGMTLKGNPRHPLYLSRKEDLEPFAW